MAKKKAQEILEEKEVLETEGGSTSSTADAVSLPLEGKALRGETTEGRYEAEVAEEIADEEDTASENKKEEYVDYILPFLPGKQMGDSQTVTINGKNYQVQYGVPVKVPIGVKEVLEDMVKAAQLLKKKIDRMTKEEQCIAKLD